MLSIEFHSPDPLDHACRALDVVRRMGLSLVGLQTRSAGANGFQIAIQCVVTSAQCADTVVARISGMPGVGGVRRTLQGQSS